MLQSIDTLWIIVCTILVLIMQAGFLCLEAGLVRSKNSINVAAKNLLDVCLGGLVFWFLGYGVMTGEYRLLAGVVKPPHNTAQFIFQLAFCATAITLIAGAIAERMRVIIFTWLAVVIAGLIYPAFANWAWYGSVTQSQYSGWLASMGFVDFAGSTVVHSLGGWVALAALIYIGPRRGRFDSDKPINGHNYPLAALGCLMLYIGWMGFNGGSVDAFNHQVAPVISNTMLAGMAGCSVGVLLSLALKNYIDVRAVLNGLLSGLVAITASAHAVGELAAVFIGAVGSLICYCAAYLMQRLKLDDPIDVVPVHAASGVWGTLAVAIFADMDVLATGLNRIEQFSVQLLGCVCAALWAFAIGYMFLRIVGRHYPVRVSPEQERQGLNVVEHNVSTEVNDILVEMEAQRISGNFSKPISVEPNTEVGQIASQYNRVIERVEKEAEIAAEMTALARAAQQQSEQAQHELNGHVQDMESFNRFAMDREMRIIELKKQINELCERLGYKPKYDLSGMGAADSKTALESNAKRSRHA